MMKKLNNYGIMKATLKIALLLLSTSTCLQVIAQQTQVEGTFGGEKGLFVYLKALTPPNTDNIAYCSIERKEVGTNEWKALDISKTPSGENDFLKRLKTAIANMPYDVSFIENKGTQIWKTYQKANAGDSLRMWFGFLPVQEALGVVYHDITAKPDVKYEYKIQQFDVKDKTLKILYYLPAKYPGEKSKWYVPYRNYTVSGKQVTVTWGAPGAKLPPFVRVYRQERNGGEWTPASSNIFSSTSKDSIFVSATDATVARGAIYRYKLVPMDIFGNPGKEAESDLVAVYNFTMQAPVIQELKANNPDGSKGVIVSWQILRNDLVNSIRIFRSTNYDNGYTLLAEVPSTESSYLDQTVEPAMKYFYKITITGPMGELSVASARVFAISDDKSKPFPPVILSATGTSKGMLITINVTENNLSGVRIYRKGEKETDLIQITELLPAKNNTVIWEDTTDISGSRIYGYAAKSENASHFQGDFSEIVYARSAKPVNIPVVMGLTADFYETYNKLFWTNMQFGATTVEGYIVYRQELPSGVMKQLNDTLISSEVNSYTDRTISGRKPYAYSVVLVDEFGNKSRMCNPVSVIPPSILVIPPSSVAGNSEQTLIRVSWNEVRSATLKEYKVYRYIRGSKATVVGTVAAGSKTEITDKNVNRGQLYFYYVISVDNDGRQSNPSTEISIRKD